MCVCIYIYIYVYIRNVHMYVSCFAYDHSRRFVFRSRNRERLAQTVCVPCAILLLQQLVLVILCKLGHVIRQLNMYGWIANCCGRSCLRLLSYVLNIRSCISWTFREKGCKLLLVFWLVLEMSASIISYIVQIIYIALAWILYPLHFSLLPLI
jgi:putative flippase GtrA